jgi:hypothetical protein
MPRYACRYRELAIRQKGSPGALYYSFLVSMNLALLLFAMWILFRLVRT